MAKTASKVKISERARGRLARLASVREGTVKSFDGTEIAWRSFGTALSGETPIICCNGLGVGTFFWVYLERMFRTSRQVITWDYRGHGRSGLKKNRKNYDLPALVKDCKAVADHLKVKKAIFIGHSLGVQVLLEFYRKWPERVAGMIFCFGTYGHPMDNFYNTRLSRYLFEACYHIGLLFPKQSNWISHLLLDNPLSFWMGGILKIMNTGMVHKEDTDRYIKHVLSVDPTFFTMLLKSAQDHSAEDILKKIKVPALIIAGELDQFTPVWISKKMNHLIPKSELLIINKATHAGLVEQPDLINLRIEKFIQERIKKK
jgi:pimeloyl-ACP methyl ester carboxylesterase